MKYLSSALMILLFCISCQAMQHDPSTLEAILNPPKDPPNPLSLQFMLNASESEDDQSDYSDLEVLPANDDMPQDDNHLAPNMPVAQEKISRGKVTNEQGQTGYECRHCKRIFPCFASSRNNHEPRCLGNPKSLNRSTRMYRPAEKNADGEPIYPCKYCEKDCHNARSRWAHQEACQTKRELGLAREKTLKCDQCNYACFRPSQLERHSVSHSTARPYPCGYCSGTFKRPKDVTSHQESCLPYQVALTLMRNNVSQRTVNMLDRNNMLNHDNNDVQMQQAE